MKKLGVLVKRNWPEYWLNRYPETYMKHAPQMMDTNRFKIDTT